MPSEVEKSMFLLRSYFNMLTNQGKTLLPQCFNYLYFFKMIKIVFESDSSFGIGKVLSLLEKFFGSFNEEFKENLSMYMMGKVFFKLFFHWSFTIRLIFHIIFISRFYYGLVEPYDLK